MRTFPRSTNGVWHARPGYTLVEMLVVIGWMSIVLTLLSGVAWSLFRLQAAATGSFERLHSEATFIDRFRADVAGAVDSPELARDFKADPLCLILSGDGGTLVVYRTIDGGVERVEMTDGATQMSKLPTPDVRAEFARRGRLMTMTIRDAKGRDLVVSAALGGGR